MFVEISLSRILIPKQKPMGVLFLFIKWIFNAVCSSLFTPKYFSTPEAEYVKHSEAGNFKVSYWGK